MLADHRRYGTWINLDENQHFEEDTGGEGKARRCALWPPGATIEERLTSAASTLLHWGLDSERIALMRLAVAEARRFPDLASTVSRTARDLSTELGVRLLGELAQSDELSSLPAFAPERLATTARLFLDLVAVPMLLRALFEVNLKVLDAEIDAHVARSVAFFLAACRNGGVS